MRFGARLRPGGCSQRSSSASSGSVCRRRWFSVADTATGREAGDWWGQRLMLRGNGPESLSWRRQGQDWPLRAGE